MILKRTTVTETVEYKKAKPGEAKESRLRTIGSLDRNPYIRLSGKWLRDAGFDIGEKFSVTVRENELVLSKMEPEI